MTTYFQYYLNQVENPFQAEIVEKDINNPCVIDGLRPKNREVSRVFMLLNIMHFSGEIKSNQNAFYVLMASEFAVLQAIYLSHYAVKPYVISYRGNIYTADIYLKDYPFIDFEQIFIEKTGESKK